MTNSDRDPIPYSPEYPKWLGPVFILAGPVAWFGAHFGPTPQAPLWVVWMIIAFFPAVGLALTLRSIGNRLLSRIFICLAAVAFYGTVNWVAIGPGERMGTIGSSIAGISTNPTHQGKLQDVRKPLIVAVTLADLGALACIAKALVNARRCRRQVSTGQE